MQHHRAIKYILTFLILSVPLLAAHGQETKVNVSLPENPVEINPMIYGQMLEDCNDNVIYGGLIRSDGSEHPKVRELLKPLKIPVMRWPAGTYAHEYHWKNGIGPKDKRPTIPCHAWGGADPHTFGTDEFLQWCERMDIEPYINFNMGNDPDFGGSIGEALDWIEYVNGGTDTMWGKRRARNGHKEPYGVKYWCIGNENYGPWGKHKAESAEIYSERFMRWAKAIDALYPDLSILGVGHDMDWNKRVLDKTGSMMDIITLHFYINPKVKEGVLVNPEEVLFAPEKIEANIVKTAEIIEDANRKFSRMQRPISISVDEWNCRHQLFDGKKYKFTRKDPRRLFDVAITAGMLNAFIRQSKAVSMANYIFPVNGHGLIKTDGDNNAYKSAIYGVFELYREIMTGKKANVSVEGPYSNAKASKFSISGDMNKLPELYKLKFKYIDSAATIDSNDNLNISLINRSHDKQQQVILNIPRGYVPFEYWKISGGGNINAKNTATNQDAVSYEHFAITNKEASFKIAPCEVFIVRCKKAR